MKYSEFINDSDMHFVNTKGEVTLDMLNAKYGDRGMTFKSESEARKYAEKLPNAIVYPIKNYHLHDVEIIWSGDGPKKKYAGQRIREGAQKHIVAWLVQSCDYEPEIRLIKKKQNRIAV